MEKFWNWKMAADGSRELRLDGVIADVVWFGDEVTPAMFRDELYGASGPVTVWINSYGGDVIAGNQIYNMLKEYPYHVKCKVDAMAASAASVVAMAGDEVLMTPVSYMLIHNPWTIAVGCADDFEHTKNLLNEIKEGIINAYEIKTKLSRVVLSHMMDDEEPMSAWKAVKLGFADGVVEADGTVLTRDSIVRSQDGGVMYAQTLVKYIQGLKQSIASWNAPPSPDTTSIAVTLGAALQEEPAVQDEAEPGIPVEPLLQRLSLIAH